MNGGSATPLGPFAIMATPAEAAAFRRATGLAGDGATLPLTFPMRWMAGRPVRDALMSLLSEPDLVPVHEGQAFDYAVPLLVDTPYTLDLMARRETAPDRLVVDGRIRGADGSVHATLETILRLFSMTAAAA